MANKVCHFCGEPGGERFILNGVEQHFHANMLKDCLQAHLKAEQEKYFKERGETVPIRGEKFSVVSGARHAERRQGW